MSMECMGHFVATAVSLNVQKCGSNKVPHAFLKQLEGGIGEWLFCDTSWFYRIIAKIVWKNMFKWGRIIIKVFFEEKEIVCSTIMKLRI